MSEVSQDEKNGDGGEFSRLLAIEHLPYVGIAGIYVIVRLTYETYSTVGLCNGNGWCSYGHLDPEV
jgi:hypothetical protein